MDNSRQYYKNCGVVKVMACKDKCKKYKASKPFGMGRYESGQSRCTMCTLYI